MLSNFERIIAVRYLRPDRKETFTSLIALFSFLGIAFGVFTLIVVMSVMGGFRQELLTRVLGIQPHVVIFPVKQKITDYISVVDNIGHIKNIDVWTMFRRRLFRQSEDILNLYMLDFVYFFC